MTSIKTSKVIQGLVDELTGSQVNTVCSAVCTAVSAVDEPNDIQHHAVQTGMNLVHLWRKRVERHSSPDCVFIFTATQDTSDGPDRFYFVGTLKEVVKKLSDLL